MKSWRPAFASVFLTACLAVGSPSGTSRTPSGRTNQVRVKLFYETLCPYSQKFITKQLWPTYLRLSAYMRVTLVPYGMATLSETIAADGQRVSQIRCQHGHHECVANMVQACAASLYKRTYRLLAYVACMESSPTPHRVGKTCASRVGLSWSELTRCVTSKKGPRLLLKMGRKTSTHKPPIRGVPYVVVNGKQDESVQDRAAENLFALVCSMFAEPVPVACATERPGVVNGKAEVPEQANITGSSVATATTVMKEDATTAKPT
ncbi:hypothetical protein HPB48_008304 [Haemaphysalis longicornis]|uniref:Gamma-interferon inducible lysosomal thiol reductase n=1 Tax=Haemaphysalis longicornis TaxID=44386 RepID=A0A9J6FW39_HAELO|nr:hypothetical protein HPB48_008304 [Haemaphysalis longicornis]